MITTSEIMNSVARVCGFGRIGLVSMHPSPPMVSIKVPLWRVSTMKKVCRQSMPANVPWTVSFLSFFDHFRLRGVVIMQVEGGQ